VTVSGDMLLLAGIAILMVGMAAAYVGNRRVLANGVPLLDWSEMTKLLEALRQENGALRTEVSGLRREVELWRVKAEDALMAVSVVSAQMNEYQQRAAGLERKIVTLLEAQRATQVTTGIPPNLRVMLTERLDLTDMAAICYEMGIDFEVISGEGKEGKVVGLLDYVERRQRMGDLLEAVRRKRKDIKV
jgi:hypothetical protein